MKVPVPCACLCLLVASVGQLYAEVPSYTKDVRPFLNKYCMECHKGNKGKAGVNLESYETMMKAGKRGKLYVVPAQPDKSQLVMSVEGKSGHKMPPKKASTQPATMEIGVLRAWVEGGAKDDTRQQSSREGNGETNAMLAGATFRTGTLAMAEADNLWRVPPVLIPWQGAPVAPLKATTDNE